MKFTKITYTVGCSIFLTVLGTSNSDAASLVYGDMDVLGTGSYPFDPLEGATLAGLLPNQVTVANYFIDNHSFPFSPEPDDFSGTDQIYVGSNQTRVGDGYSRFPERVNGPLKALLDYSTLVPTGSKIETLTLGIAADDFQFPVFQQSFTASVEGLSNAALTNQLNSFDQSGPDTQFFTIGIDPSILSNDYILDLSIDQLGTGTDGWAVDFYTIGVTTKSVPEPSSVVALAFLGFCLGVGRCSRKYGR